METYKVVLTPDAATDLYQLKHYISYTLKAPETAAKYIRSVRKQIEGLEAFPTAYAPIPEEPWHLRGIRRIIHKNFNIYYIINDLNKTVYILNVIYGKRDQLEAFFK